MNRRTLALSLLVSALMPPVLSSSRASDPAVPLSPAPAQPEAQPLQLRVLSFNLRYKNQNDKDERSWEARRAEAVEVIREDKPDLIGYQEALRSMLDDLGSLISGYEEIGVGREDGKTKGEYSAIWIKKDRFTVQESGTFWLSDTPDVPNSKTWGNRVTRVCTWAKLQDKPTGREFHFYNLHLDHESQEARDKGTAQVIRFMENRRPAGPFVLTGDFNSGEDSSVVKAVRESSLGLVDSWRVLHPETPLSESGTYHDFTGVRSRSKIDYIFVPKTARLIDAAIIYRHSGNVWPSDHYPLRATVEFPAP
ncbi:MAG: endonuclease/exonuclease/phosphatase family protein [Verrucomicrobiaceae bacterium]|nr:MAG: endonuclease/exonuclease/phosphatase family protein [Verrucomicrobiaceae bacterium]